MKMVEIGPLLSVKFKKERKRKEKMEKIDPLCCDDCPVMQLWLVLPASNHPDEDDDDDIGDLVCQLVT